MEKGANRPPSPWLQLAPFYSGILVPFYSGVDTIGLCSVCGDADTHNLPGGHVLDEVVTGSVGVTGHEVAGIACEQDLGAVRRKRVVGCGKRLSIAMGTDGGGARQLDRARPDVLDEHITALVRVCPDQVARQAAE